MTSKSYPTDAFARRRRAHLDSGRRTQPPGNATSSARPGRGRREQCALDLGHGRIPLRSLVERWAAPARAPDVAGRAIIVGEAFADVTVCGCIIWSPERGTRVLPAGYAQTATVAPVMAKLAGTRTGMRGPARHWSYGESRSRSRRPGADLFEHFWNEFAADRTRQCRSATGYTPKTMLGRGGRRRMRDLRAFERGGRLRAFGQSPVDGLRDA